MINELNVTVQKTQKGQDYIQILSADQTTVNIVLIAEKINIEDSRKGKK